MKIIAYGGVPKQGGIFTFYQTLRSQLRHFDWDMQSVTIGSQLNALWDDRFADEGCVRLVISETSLKRQAMAFVDWCLEHHVAVVMPAHSTPILSAIPHIPSNVRLISRSIDSLESGYRRITYAKEHISHFVATSPLHFDTLSNLYGINTEKISLIPHGIDIEQFRTGSRKCVDILRLVFVGRLYHPEKGVLFLPHILQGLENRRIPYHLTIIGSGDDEPILRVGLQPFTEMKRVTFVGMVPRSSIPGYLTGADVMLFPSQREAFGFALIEGMAAGCAIVASYLPGVSDFIIEDGETGILCPIGDVGSFVNAIATLHGDRVLLKRFQEKAADSAVQRFSQKRMALNYLSVLENALAEPPQEKNVRSWNDFTPPDFLGYSRFGFFPKPIRQFARRALRRLT